MAWPATAAARPGWPSTPPAPPGGGGPGAGGGGAGGAEPPRRARAMMRTYRQGGRARVYFETIPLSRDPARAAIVRLCNQAFVEAARGLTGVSVLRMDLLFSPHGYQETIRDGGRDVRVREDDGVHLNASGTAIEARETARAIRGREVSSAGWRPQAPS